MRRLVAVLLTATISLAAQKCEAETGVQVIGPGKHAVTSGMYGLWIAESTTKGCHWTLGKGSFEGGGDHDQTVQIGTAQKGQVFWTNDGCGNWRKR